MIARTDRAHLIEDCQRCGGRALAEVPLARLTTWHIGGPAEMVIEPHSAETLRRVLLLAARRGYPLRLLGNGSNVLAPDSGVRGIVVKLAGGYAQVEFQGHHVRAEAGAFLPKLARDAAARGLAGLECVVGVPGTVGGGVVMNAGVPGATLGERVTRVEARPLGLEQLETFDRDACRFRHRGSRFCDSQMVIWSVELELEPDDPAAIAARMDEHMAHRRATQPLYLPSAGSVFKRPADGTPPGRLLEEAGCKGLRRGGAAVSELHANWIVNLGGATADDVRGLIDTMRQRVLDHCGVALELEVVVWQEAADRGTASVD